MKRITFLFIALFCITPLFAQITKDDVVYWVGEGQNEAVVTVDFNDETPDFSFTWGVRFDTDTLTINDALLMVQGEDTNFSVEETYYDSYQTYFLDDVYYNQHQGVNDGGDGAWSAWTGSDPDSFSSNSGVGGALEDGKWYGFSYGFNPMTEPDTKYAAYNSEWLKFDDIDEWFGEGEHKTIITIDFVSDQDTNPVTFAWGLRYEGDEEGGIRAKDALETLADLDDDLSIEIDDNNKLTQVTYQELNRVDTDTTTWHSFIGSNMSTYIPADQMLQWIHDGEIFGVSYGNDQVRRPYIPTIVDNPNMRVSDHDRPKVMIWPNPTAHTLHIETPKQIKQVGISNMRGQVVYRSDSKEIDVTGLSSGNYFITISDENGVTVHRFVKK